MKPINQRSLFLVLLLIIPACAIKNYDGPEMPEDQVATIELKRPVMSLVPLFWIFPLNMLTWHAEDWRETSWGGHFTVKGWQIQESKPISLNRFVSIRASPGLQSAESIDTVKIGEEPTGSESCTSETRSCQKKGDKDDKKRVAKPLRPIRRPRWSPSMIGYAF